MKNNGVKNEHKINTYRRTDQLWLFPSLHFMIFVMPAMFGSIFLMSGYIAVMFLEQIGTAIICTALMFRHLFAMSGRREAVIIGVFHRLPSVLSMSFPRFGAVIAEPPFFFCITSFHGLMIRLLYTGRLLLLGKDLPFLAFMKLSAQCPHEEDGKTGKTSGCPQTDHGQRVESR